MMLILIDCFVMIMNDVGMASYVAYDDVVVAAVVVVDVDVVYEVDVVDSYDREESVMLGDVKNV